VKIQSVYQGNSYLYKDTVWNEVYWQLYEAYSGSITLEKIDQLLSIYWPLEQQTADLTASTAMDNPNTYTGNLYSDFYLLRDYYVRPMEYAYMYRYNANEIVRIAQENMDFYSEIGNEYKYLENEIIAERFSGRGIDDFAYMEMYQYYLEYDFSALLVLLICLYGLVGVFVSERESDMDAVLLTTISGGRKTVIAKILSSMLFIFAVCLWFWLLDFALFSFSFGSLEAADLPLYGLKNFENTALSLSMGQYAFLAAIIKTGGMTVVGMAFLFISSVSKNALIPFAANLTLTGGIILQQEIMAGSEYVLAKIINPFILVSNSELFKEIEFINFFDTPILSYVAAPLIAAIIGVILIILLLLTARVNAAVGR